jgi:hypothetical protein
VPWVSCYVLLTRRFLPDPSQWFYTKGLAVPTGAASPWHPHCGVSTPHWPTSKSKSLSSRIEPLVLLLGCLVNAILCVQWRRMGMDSDRPDWEFQLSQLCSSGNVCICDSKSQFPHSFLFFFLSLFLPVLEYELRASCLLRQVYSHLSRKPSLFLL